MSSGVRGLGSKGCFVSHVVGLIIMFFLSRALY